MFDIKCSRCKFFSIEELCQKGLDEESCDSFSCMENPKEDKPDCLKCEWFLDGSCIFDFNNPSICRRFKSK